MIIRNFICNIQKCIFKNRIWQLARNNTLKFRRIGNFVFHANFSYLFFRIYIFIYIYYNISMIVQDAYKKYIIIRVYNAYVRLKLEFENLSDMSNDLQFNPPQSH